MTRTTARILGLAAFLLSGCDANEGLPPPASPPPSAPTPADAKGEAPPAGGDAKGGDAKADGEAKAADAKANDGAPPTADPAATPVAAVDSKNAAFFVVRGKGIVALTKSGWSTVPGSQSVFLAGFVHGADGNLYGQTSSDIVRIEVGGLPSVAPLGYDEVGSVAGFDVGAKGEVWTIGDKGVAEYRDGAWKTEGRAAVGLGEDFAVGIALDSAGDPWAATSDGLVHRVAGAWQAGKLPSGPTKYLDQLGRGPDGQVYISTYDQLFRLTGTPGRVKVKKGSYESPGKFAFAEAKYGVVASGIEDASIFLPDAEAMRFTGKRDLKIGTVAAVAADTQGRVWVTGDAGIAIVGPGQERVTWRSGSIEVVAGQVSAVAVRGEGPPLPEAGAVKKGGLRGHIVKAGAGLAGVKVELCESPSLIYSRTPCSGSPTHLRGTTDAEGNFTFEDVPLGAYGIAVKSGRKWQITLGAALGNQMSEGVVYDIGSLELK